MLPALLALCLFAAPVDGEVVAPFAPEGDYGGHWGIDVAAAPGTPVSAVAPGMVTFAGSVAGRLSVTVHHGGGVRTSYSYLSTIGVEPGVTVDRGDVVGTTGMAHGTHALHFSLRVGDRYVDPRLVSCLPDSPGPGVRLAPAA